MAETTPENLQNLYHITPDWDAGFAVVTTEEIDMPAPWTAVCCAPVLQMVYGKPVQGTRTAAARIMNLSDGHIPEMMALANLTKPGPFRERTIDLGFYQGIFEEGRLVAMAGQRMHPTPYAEISAVCTHPDYIGRGYAAQLIRCQIGRIRDAGEIPFLHVSTTNQRAIKLYESLGFVARKNLFVYFIKK